MWTADSDAPFTTQLQRSYYWDTFTPDPVQQQTVQAETLRGKELTPTATECLFSQCKGANASGKSQEFSGFSEEYYKQSRVKAKVYKMPFKRVAMYYFSQVFILFYLMLCVKVLKAAGNTQWNNFKTTLIERAE